LGEGEPDAAMGTDSAEFLVRKADPWSFPKLGKGYSASGVSSFRGPVYFFGRGFLTQPVKLL